MRQLPWPARIYILAIAALALLASMRALATPVDLWTFTVTVALFVFVESVSIIRVSRGILVSAGFPVTLASAIMLGPWWAAVVGLTGAVNYHPGGLPLVKRVFNGCQLALSVLLCGLVYQAMDGVRSLTVDDFPEVLLAVLAAAAVYSIANALLVSGVLVAAEGLSPKDAWHRTAMPIVSYLGYGMFGLLMAVLWNTPVNALAAVLVLLPLMVARWMFAQYVNERAAYDRTVRTLVQAVETKDYYTRGHSERVSRGSVMIARKLRMSGDRTELLRFAGILHDLGKLGVPTRVLQKSGALTQDEFAAIHLHPVRGVEMVRDIRFLQEAYDGIMHHHERMDGKGYPQGLSGSDIPEFARVIAVADAFDSMTSTRSYRAARGIPEALDELERCKGTHFDPTMVHAFREAVAKDGWTPAEAPSAPPEPGAQITRYDHDDPTTALPVVKDDQ